MKFLMAGALLALGTIAAPAGAQVTVRSVRVLAVDVEATARFYERAFGMSETRRPANSATFREIVLNTGATPEAARAAASTPIVIATRRDPAEKPVSMAALILEVRDMEATLSAIIAAGGRGGKVNTSQEGLSYAMVADPEGNPIELILRR